MPRLLLAAAASIAALALPASPAAAEHGPAPGPPRFVSPEPFPGGGGICRSFHRDRHGERRVREFRCGPLAGGWAYADGEWALYNNRSWESDSYNDWWHDRPDRAFPRWVQQQRGGPCEPERMWWSGNGWRC